MMAILMYYLLKAGYYERQHCEYPIYYVCFALCGVTRMIHE